MKGRRYELLKTIRPNVTLWRDRMTGVALIEDCTSGTGGSCHPNIDATGSLLGMVECGYWNPEDRVIRSAGFLHNIDGLVIDSEDDKMVADACCCPACSERRLRRAMA